MECREGLMGDDVFGDAPDKKLFITLYDAQNRKYILHHWEGVSPRNTWSVWKVSEAGYPILYDGPDRFGYRWFPDKYGTYKPEWS